MDQTEFCYYREIQQTLRAKLATLEQRDINYLLTAAESTRRVGDTYIISLVQNPSRKRRRNFNIFEGVNFVIYSSKHLQVTLLKRTISQAA